jgi:hypothetical protein
MATNCQRNCNLMSDGGVHDYDFIRTRMKDLGLDPFARKNEADAAPKPPVQIGTCSWCKDNQRACNGNCGC